MREIPKNSELLDLDRDMATEQRAPGAGLSSWSQVASQGWVPSPGGSTHLCLRPYCFDAIASSSVHLKVLKT